MRDSAAAVDASPVGGSTRLDWLTWGIDALARETMLFAAAGLLIGGVDDALVDLCFLVQRMRREHRPTAMSGAPVPPPPSPARLAVFVPAWDEARVIGAMLSAALARLDHPDYRLYVGLYPNDPATIDAAAAVAERDPRVRLVIGSRDGPTTKADCLNTLWHALRRAEAGGETPAAAVIVHDAEDVVHRAELAVFDALLRDHDVVQLPVLPLVKRGSRLVSGHYADEFAEAHCKQIVVRTALGAAMPLAGTGCAIRTEMLARIARRRGGDPFDATSLTEDYELGLRIAAMGGRGLFARVADADGPVAVRAYFPGTIPAAIRQKARWMTGIALVGWDRTGWAAATAFGDHWMRMRDRRAPLAVLVLAVAYVAVLAWGLRALVHWAGGSPPPGDVLANWLLGTTTALLGWRLAMRIVFTWRCYDGWEACWSVPRFFIGNVVALVAAPRALTRYVAMLRGAAPVWDKTHHDFPELGPILRG